MGDGFFMKTLGMYYQLAFQNDRFKMTVYNLVALLCMASIPKLPSMAAGAPAASLSSLTAT